MRRRRVQSSLGAAGGSGTVPIMLFVPSVDRDGLSIDHAYWREEARASRADVRVDIAARDGQVGPRASRDRRVRQPVYPTPCRECGAPVVVGITPNGQNLLLDAEPSATASGYALVSGGRTPRFAPTTALPAYRPHWDVCSAIRPAGRRRP